MTGIEIALSAFGLPVFTVNLDYPHKRGTIKEEMMMKIYVLALLGAVFLTACGDKPATSEVAATDQAKTGVADEECGDSGYVCQEDSECITTSMGNSFCALLPVPAVVALVDSSLGGRCLGNVSSDLFPGVSIGTVEIKGLGFTDKGFGKLVWDKPGFEVAEHRGTAPNGRKFEGDICTQAFNLGCDGVAIFDVLDENGNVLGMREGDSVVVQIRGDESCGESFGDGLKMMLCFDTEAARQGDMTSCGKPGDMNPLGEELFGVDHYGGTVQYVPQPKR